MHGSESGLTGGMEHLCHMDHKLQWLETCDRCGRLREEKYCIEPGLRLLTEQKRFVQ
jgi:hypothetical protein